MRIEQMTRDDLLREYGVVGPYNTKDLLFAIMRRLMEVEERVIDNVHCGFEAADETDRARYGTVVPDPVSPGSE